jgi:hypothetical protein
MAETGPLWLTREDDVVAHLYFAAAEIGEGTMEIGPHQVPGSLSFPNVEENTFSFFTHGEVDLSAAPADVGEVVRFRYVQGESTYTFLSVIVEISDQQARRRWRIKFPTAVERNERRLVRRHRVMGRTGFHLTSDIRGGQRDKWPLYDIAAAGVSFVVDTKFKIELGTQFAATVHLPGLEPLAAMIQMRNLRPMPGDGKHKLAGCRFVELTPSDREALSNALARME